MVYLHILYELPVPIQECKYASYANVSNSKLREQNVMLFGVKAKSAYNYHYSK